MQQVTVPKLNQRMDLAFYQALLDSTGLKITYTQLNYAPVEGPGGPGEVKLVVGAEGYTRFSAKCEQMPELDLTHSKEDLLHYITYNYLVKTTRFCVVVDGAEIFGTATALRDLGFFKEGNEIRVAGGKYDGTSFIRMEPVTESNGRDAVPYHRFFARRLVDLPKVHDVLKTKGKIKEISFLPDSFTQLLHEDAFTRKPESQG